MAAIVDPNAPFGGPPSDPGASLGPGTPVSAEAPRPGVPRRDRVLGALVVVALLAILAATVVWRAGRDDSGDRFTAFVDPQAETAPPTTSDQPEVWPIEIQPLAEFVERERGGPFDHPVPIEYLEEDDYAAAVSASSQLDSEEDRADLEDWAAQMRSLGLLAPGVDVEAAMNQLYGEGTLAFYDEEEEAIKVRGSNFDVAHRVTLVHELTHAWQDQNGYVPDFDALDDTAASTIRAVIEGDATRIENAYIDSLTSREQDQYLEQSREQAGDVDLSGVPGVLVTGLSSAYALGEPFVAILDEQGGNRDVNEALSDPPPADADLLEPVRYLDGVQPIEVAEPSVPAGAERVDGGDFGALSWLMVLSERIDPRDALTVADTWAGDQYVSYRSADRMCTAIAYRAENGAMTSPTADLVRAWADGSVGLGATVEVVGDDVVLRSCEAEPGSPAVQPADRTELGVSYATLRTQAFAEALTAGADVEQAACFGEYIVRHISPQEMAAGAASDPATAQRLGREGSEACL